MGIQTVLDISCIILTYNSYTFKGGCVEHVFMSILRQAVLPKEVIVIENSSIMDDRQKFYKFLSRISTNIDVRVVESSLGRSAARNQGIEDATGKIVVFVDDDTVLLTPGAFEIIDAATEEHTYGCGAIRFWTQPEGWFESNSQTLLENILEGDFGLLREHLDLPYKVARWDSVDRSKSNIHLTRSFIANFGFVERHSLMKVGGFRTLFDNHWGFEDTALLFDLLLLHGQPKILTELEVAHVTHTIKYGKKDDPDFKANRALYKKILHEHGIEKVSLRALLFPDIFPDLDPITFVA